MTTMETFDQLVSCSRYIRKGNPGVFVGREVFPAHEVLVALSDLAAVEDGVDVEWRIRIFGEDERGRWRVWMEVGWVVVGLEKGDMKDGMKTGEVRWETEFVHEIG